MAAALEFVRANSAWIASVLALIIWLLHFFRKSAPITVLILAVVGLSAAFFIFAINSRQALSVIELTSMLLLYGVSLFVILGDVLIGGLAQFLTAKRGENWTKELDYVYLTLASVGIVGTLNRLEFVTDSLRWAEPIAPLFFTTAVVIRFIKTRAEIEGWNKPVA